MEITRRETLLGGLATGLVAGPLAGCGEEPPISDDITQLYVMGTIHSNHRTSDTYSLAVLEAAVRKAKPDIILTEIPPDRIDRAITSFAETGEVDEPRTEVFPEYTDVIIPLSQELGFRLVGTAAWTQEIADNRRAALERIRSDPARVEEWAEHITAQRRYAREIAGRGDDPRFIHTREFDRLVEESREPYWRNFEEDLGPGGWLAINGAHTDLINDALYSISGQGLTAMITFGTAHKYMILRSLLYRRDIQFRDTRALFA